MKPNCFLLGAPKCGTTSLAAWLSEHPEVFMSKPKELDFFDTDIWHGYRDDLKHYMRYFANVDPSAIVIAEASTGYLRSHVAVSNIMEFAPDACFIVGLRNPVELAVSWHGHGLAGNWETERDFSSAWRLQAERRIGRCVPRNCPDKERLLYGDVCKLGDQMRRLFDLVPEERVFVYTLGEMKNDPAGLWHRVLQFLRISPQERSEFPAWNLGRELPDWVSWLGRSVHQVKRQLHLSGLGLGLTNHLVRSFARTPDREISVSLHRELCDYFEEDMELLYRLTGKDLRLKG